MVIIGGAPGWEEAPQDGAWVHGNQLDRFLGKIGRVFEIHDDLSEHPPEYPKWLVDHNIPMIVGESFPIKADHVKIFPKEANVLNSLCSTPSYMMALAIHEGYKEIDIYGIDMAVNDHEYSMQRPSMYAWIGYAKGKGINVRVHSKSLFNDLYDEGRDWGRPLNNPYLEMAQKHQNKIDQYFNQIKELEKLIQTHDGCRQVYERLAKVQRAKNAGIDVDITTEPL